MNGIIPARAGFTWPSAESSAPDRDHPRSRGVYERYSRCAPGVQGSSPLARGLLRHLGVNARDCGIIPARAGFTLSRRPEHASQTDHPRSRGVYDLNTWDMILLQGSSPLARGLRFTVWNCDATSRIIPARAGFTVCHGE